MKQQQSAGTGSGLCGKENKKMSKWFEEEAVVGSNVVSSRIRLTRNWADYVFPSRLSKEEAKEMVGRLKEEFRSLAAEDELGYADFETISDLERRAMRERRLINRTMVGRTAPAGLLVSPEEDVSIVLNGTDHIRIQVQSSGLCLQKVWERANWYDDKINEKIPYAYDEKYGYLTSFPTNVGTGMRASVVMHLPMLSQGKKFNSLVTDMSRFGVAVKGLMGEGNENYGSFYEVSNQKTMGQTEQELIALVTKAVRQLNAQENEVRHLAWENNSLEQRDEVYKSFGVLCYARKLSMKEAMTYLSQVMMGICDGWCYFDEPCNVYELILGIQPANLQLLGDRPYGKEEISQVRAAYLREKMPELLEKE